MAVKLTERAARELKRLFVEKNKPDTTIVRLGVAGGGCSGFEYRMEFTESTASDDLLSESQGLRLAVDPRSARFVDGTEIDFHDDLLKRAFVFNNPLAVKTCGCGTSFKA
jgi:iron-sulfur cluster assembly accessory protein